MVPNRVGGARSLGFGCCGQRRWDSAEGGAGPGSQGQRGRTGGWSAHASAQRDRVGGSGRHTEDMQNRGLSFRTCWRAGCRACGTGGCRLAVWSGTAPRRRRPATGAPESEFQALIPNHDKGQVSARGRTAGSVPCRPQELRTADVWLRVPLDFCPCIHMCVYTCTPVRVLNTKGMALQV